MSVEVQSFSTQLAPCGRGGAFWRDWVCDVFVSLDCPDLDAGFRGDLTHRTLGDLHLTNVRTTPHSVTRTPRHIGRANTAPMLVGLQKSGQCTLTQDGRSAVLSPGDIALYDARRPYDLQFEGAADQLILRIDHEVLATRLTAPDTMTARRIPATGAYAQLANAYADTLVSVMDAGEVRDTSLLTLNLLNVLSAALNLECPAEHRASNSRTLTLYRIKAFIDEHLGDAELDVNRVAAAFGISRRYLGAIFADLDETPSRWIWTRRLERCHADLTNPALRRVQITEVAFKWGFNDAGHFSRAFRARYGETPSEARHAILIGSGEA